MIADFGQQALISIISHLLFISITWWALQSLNFEKFLKPNHVIQARLLLIFITIVIGATVSNFFLDYMIWSRQIPTMF
ncbi:DUF1146 family protein [Cytobacillus sp. S13-E01]|uniref:DUF1146 family protein n=1 Tax=Cytobacillus sp. S13-E01 TaxID=3031326 RepID=UPI0023D8BA01|nr:DUF1146 family protein [Cytobacillus sp. S13-E01]MDF0726591.1 DUF1146 family protein [Cytobacillus sp. S13-E01]